MKQCYTERKFKPESMAKIEQANAIIEEYQADGFTLTLRQLYYQFVSRDVIPNSDREYKNLGSILNDARLAGLVDWDAIEDRTRNLRRLPAWDSPADVIRSVSRQYRNNLWADQPSYCEVWIEKDALIGVIEPICNELRVPFFACRGYTSQSEVWSAGQRLIEHLNDGQAVTVFHLGDHDPSGIDMTRDNEDRLRMFIAAEADESMFQIERLALNMDQVKRYKPPPNPAKLTDSRATGYLSKFGDKSWELDALDPKVIARMIRENVDSLIDDEKWEAAIAKEQRGIKKLAELAKRGEDF